MNAAPKLSPEIAPSRKPRVSRTRIAGAEPTRAALVQPATLEILTAAGRVRAVRQAERELWLSMDWEVDCG